MTMLWRVQCTVYRDEVEAVEDVLLPLSVAMDEAVADEQSQLSFLMQAKPSQSLLTSLPCHATVTVVADQDWLAVGARGATQAGPFTLLPLNEAALANADTILIDGRYAFGDGHHPTTIGCILAMDTLKAARIMPQRMADIGCGTGVLALAAAKLWPEIEVIASDCDEAAVAATLAAADANSIALRVFEANGFDGHQGAYDLILMNLLLGPLLALAAEVAQHLMPGGCCILSGILPEQTETVVAAYEAQGLAELQRTQHDGWMTLMFKKP